MSALHSFRGVAAVMLLAIPAAVVAQGRSSAPLRTETKPSAVLQSKSADLAVELAKLLESRSLTNIAAPQNDTYVGALYMPGVQLLVVSGKVNSGERMQYLLEQKNYKEAYQDLNSASDRSTKILISDLGANGLRCKREKDQPDFSDRLSH